MSLEFYSEAIKTSPEMMNPIRTSVDTLTSGVEAVRNLFQQGFANLDLRAGHVGLMANTEIEHVPVAQKSVLFFRDFLPLRQQMIGLLTESYRRYFKIALAHASQTGDDPDSWAWIQLQPALHLAFEWIREWYILACEGQNQSVRHVGSMPFVPGGTGSMSIPTTAPPFSPAASWRAPAWLFGVSAAHCGIGLMKQQHVPNMDSDEKLGESHTRLLLKGARRAFLLDLGPAIETVRNEETAAAGAIRELAEIVRRRGPNKRKGWEQRTKLYGVIKKVLSANPSPQGMEFCAELDRRRALPLLDWVMSGEWRKGLTWKEAWGNPDLRRKIRRVRQEAQRAS